MVNARRRRQTRNLRPHSRDPIAHNEAVRLRKRMRYLARQAKLAASHLRAFNRALGTFRFVIVDEVPPGRLAELVRSAGASRPSAFFHLAQPINADPATFPRLFWEESTSPAPIGKDAA